jgi:hypothetical protein
MVAVKMLHVEAAVIQLTHRYLIYRPSMCMQTCLTLLGVMWGPKWHKCVAVEVLKANHFLNCKSKFSPVKFH